MAHWSVGKIRGPETRIGEKGAPVAGLFFSADIVGATKHEVEICIGGYAVKALLKKRVPDVNEVARELVEQYLEKRLDEDSEPMGKVTLQEDQVMELFSCR